MDDLGFHVIAGDHLLEMLRRAQNGESPDMIMMELWANADHECFQGDDE